jgi:purine-nucleoside phosphorylase
LAAAWPGPEVVEFVRGRMCETSEIGLVLGSGLGGIADELDDRCTLTSGEIPGYPSSTVSGHEGRLHLGEWGGRRIWCVQGRVHLYEGHTPEVTTRYVRLLHALGVRTLLLTNAAGSLTTSVQPGEIVLDRDAISLFFQPLAQPAEPNLPWRRRGALSDSALAQRARETGLELGIPFHEGTLVGGLGPTYETAAEVRAWRRLGGTVASMSTVPEAIQARELGLRLLMFSLVTNLGTGLSVTPLSHAEVVEVADRAGAELARLLRGIVGRI